MPSWTVSISSSARKAVLRAPRNERERLRVELDRVAVDPLGGDTVRLRGLPNAARRRVGDWRILFDLDAPTSPAGPRRRTEGATSKRLMLSRHGYSYSSRSSERSRRILTPGESLARLVGRLGLGEMMDDCLEERAVGPAGAPGVLEHPIGELVLECRDALGARVRSGPVVHQGAPVVAGALVGVGEPRVHTGGVGRIRLACQELLATVDNRLIRHGVVSPRLPAPREHADH